MADTLAVPAARDLITRLPRTFGPSFNDQLAQWDLLFPAEQRRLRAQVEWLDRLPAAEFKQLFAPIVELESKMDLPHWDPATRGMSVTDTGILARSPLYPAWRDEVAKVFARIDTGVGASGGLPPIPRLIACVLPSGLPPSKDPMWPSLAKQGTWVTLDRPFGDLLVPLAAALAARKRPAGLEDVESTWIFECDTRLSDAPPESTARTVVSWKALEPVRREFLNRLNTVRRDLRSVDETTLELKRLDIGRSLPRSVAAETRVLEFVRGVLLSGNGSLVFPSSFVQWGASEALRRVEPQCLLACFGLRQKLKPFSSTVLFEDQQRSNPTPDADDPAGSLVDALLLAQYVYLSSQRVQVFGERTLVLMTGAGLNRVLVLGQTPPSGTLPGPGLIALAVRHLQG
jgi:hypothetical protein